MARLKLTPDQKLYIVVQLARFVDPVDIQQKFQSPDPELRRSLGIAASGIAMSLSAISIYNPSTVAGRRLSTDLKAVFAETREQFLHDVEGIPEWHQAVRVRELAQMLRDKLVGKNPRLRLEILERIAKEAGGAYTNRREITGADGKPIAVKTEVIKKPDLRALTQAEIAVIEELLEKAEHEGPPEP